ncbi:MAG: histidinol-phosphate transaminase [Alloprevotella sp.]
MTFPFRKHIAEIAPYSTARDEFKGGDISVWLDANESPYNNGVNRYPDPHQKALKQVLSQLKGVATDRIFVGNGSDEAIDLCFRLFCEPGEDNVVAIAPSYGMYSVAAAVNNVELREVQLREDFSLPVEELLAACDAHTRLLWVCSPNNPSGNAFSPDDLLHLARNFDGMLVVDEAYADFSEKGSMLAHLDDCPCLIVLQTLSKAWGMAGLRLGLSFSHPVVAAAFAKIKYPYNVNAPTQEEVIRRLSSEPVAEHVAEIKAERRRLEEELPGIACVKKVYPSDANFLLVEVTDANAIYDALVAAGIIVRNRSRIVGCRSCLRLTVGTPAENRRLVEVLRTLS